ncbi:MAG: peptidase C15 [Beijerinckiaceae bacterium]|nr:peptidase C15 [Beijerinckiaceae bacterium]
MDDRPDILITGFGPFPHVRVNPTTALARMVADRLKRSGLETDLLVMETSYAVGLPAMKNHLEKTRPRAVLMLGLAARARFVRVELFGRGNASRLHPDATGATPTDPTGSRSALPLRTSGNPAGALAALRHVGISARLSASAGRYLCDACYAAALRHAERSGVPVIFIHVPWLRPAPGLRPLMRTRPFRPGPASLGSALAAIGRDLARIGRQRA